MTLNRIYKWMVILFSVFCCWTAKAQPIIDQSVYPLPSTSVLVIDYSNFQIHEDFTKAGAQQIWNFSELKGSDIEQSLGYLPVNNTPYAALFPEANLAMTHDKLKYDYFKFENDGYTMLGSMELDTSLGIEILNQRLVNNYSQSFPIVYGQVNEDAYVEQLSVLPFYIVESNSTIHSEVDAYGTLIIGSDTFNDVARVKDVIYRTGTVKPIHPKAKTGGHEARLIEYTWWKNGMKVPLFKIRKSEGTNTIINTKNEKKIDTISSLILTYSKEIPQYLTDKQIFPLDLRVSVTSDKMLQVFYKPAIKGKSQCVIVDATGKLIATIEESNEALYQEQRFNYNASALASGLYFISVLNGSQKESIKIFLRN